jgi:hypothetical protein
MTKVSLKRPTAHGTVEIEADLDEAIVERVLLQALREAPALSGVATFIEDSAKQERKSNGRKHTPIADDVAIELRKRIPTTEQVVAYIKGQPNRAHSQASVTSHFLHTEVASNSTSRLEMRLFWRIQDRMIAARHVIEREDKTGKFVGDTIRKIGHSRIYSWKLGA